jgi:hypothetical protein
MINMLVQSSCGNNHHILSGSEGREAYRYQKAKQHSTLGHFKFSNEVEDFAFQDYSLSIGIVGQLSELAQESKHDFQGFRLIEFGARSGCVAPTVIRRATRGDPVTKSNRRSFDSAALRSG